jgi:pimeloyl-ACP methyl ester carboxylesterase
VSTPPHLRLPDFARAYHLDTPRGRFAVHDARPPAGVPARGTAVLVPGFTGSKEDFIAVLDPIARTGWRVVALDMRGQYESAGADDVAAYRLDELAQDLLAVAGRLSDGPVHLVGHSFGGLAVRAAVLSDPDTVRSVTLLSSGPGPISGHEAERARLLEAALQQYDLAYIWQIVDATARTDHEYDGVAPEVREFLRRRFLANAKSALLAMVRTLLDTPDRTDELAKTGLPLLVAYGEGDYVWTPAEQSRMARRLGARDEVIRGARHSPAAERPHAAAALLTRFWDDAA